MQGSQAIGSFDGVQYFTIKLPDKPMSGWAALGTDSFGLADFDNLSIKPAQALLAKQDFKQSPQVLYFQSEGNH